MKWPFWIALPILLAATGCGTLQQATTHGLSDGKYKLVSDQGRQPVYLSVKDDSLAIYTIKENVLSKDSAILIQFDVDHSPLKLSKSGLDFDIATILFKYRFKTNTLPAQVNSNLNLAGYLGYKKEFFRFTSRKTPDGRFKTHRLHYSFDAGLFTGFGATTMNASTTNGFLTTEYDGFIWQNGAATFIGFDIFTFGIGVGFDTLLDSNRKTWIYNGKPWLGLMIGLTLQN